MQDQPELHSEYQPAWAIETLSQTTTKRKFKLIKVKSYNQKRFFDKRFRKIIIIIK